MMDELFFCLLLVSLMLLCKIDVTYCIQGEGQPSGTSSKGGLTHRHRPKFYMDMFSTQQDPQDSSYSASTEVDDSVMIAAKTLCELNRHALKKIALKKKEQETQEIALVTDVESTLKKQASDERIDTSYGERQNIYKKAETEKEKKNPYGKPQNIYKKVRFEEDKKKHSSAKTKKNLKYKTKITDHEISSIEKKTAKQVEEKIGRKQGLPKRTIWKPLTHTNERTAKEEKKDLHSLLAKAKQIKGKRKQAEERENAANTSSTKKLKTCSLSINYHDVSQQALADGVWLFEKMIAAYANLDAITLANKLKYMPATAREFLNLVHFFILEETSGPKEYSPKEISAKVNTMLHEEIRRLLKDASAAMSTDSVLVKYLWHRLRELNVLTDEQLSIVFTGVTQLSLFASAAAGEQTKQIFGSLCEEDKKIADALLLEILLNAFRGSIVQLSFMEQVSEIGRKRLLSCLRRLGHVLHDMEVLIQPDLLPVISSAALTPSSSYSSSEYCNNAASSSTHTATEERQLRHSIPPACHASYSLLTTKLSDDKLQGKKEEEKTRRETYKERFSTGRAEEGSYNLGNSSGENIAADQQGEEQVRTHGVKKMLQRRHVNEQEEKIIENIEGILRRIVELTSENRKEISIDSNTSKAGGQMAAAAAAARPQGEKSLSSLDFSEQNEEDQLLLKFSPYFPNLVKLLQGKQIFPQQQRAPHKSENEYLKNLLIRMFVTSCIQAFHIAARTP